MSQKVRHDVHWAAEYEFCEFASDDIVIAELARARVRVGHLWNRKDWDWAAESATPFVHIVERSGAGSESVELDTEALRDQLDIVPLVYGWQFRKDGGQRPERAAEAATMFWPRERRNSGRVEATAEEDDILAGKTPSHSLPQQLQKAVPNVVRAEPGRLNQLQRI